MPPLPVGAVEAGVHVEYLAVGEADLFARLARSFDLRY